MCLGLYLLFCCLFGLIYFVLFLSFPAICDIFSIHFSPLLAHNCISLFSVVAVGFTLGIFDLLQSSFKSYTISAISKTLNNNILPWSLPLSDASCFTFEDTTHVFNLLYELPLNKI